MSAAATELQAPLSPHAGFRLEFRPAPHDGALACWIAWPDRVDHSARVLVAVHGIRRGAQEQAALFGPKAAALGRIVIAPLFDAQHWPRYQRLGDGADAALLELLEGLGSDAAAPLDRLVRFDLCGFSGGAQFAHRFAMLHPERIGRLSLASAGWYTFPDHAPYPYGLGPPGGSGARTARLQARLDAFLRLPIDVCVGERDNRRDANTRSGDDVDRQQGRDRRTRASRWSEAVAIEAAVRGTVPRIQFVVLPGCGHNFRRCAQRGGLVERVLREPIALPRWPLPREFAPIVNLVCQGLPQHAPAALVG